jgi:lipoprotein NlpD
VEDFGTSEDFAASVFVERSGSITVVGTAGDWDEDSRFAAARLTADGDLGPTYGQGGVATCPASPVPSKPNASQQPQAGKPATPAPVAVPTTSNITWRWPADGGVIGTYANGDPTLQGVDIGGKAGQPVRAAGDGVVVYSGSGLVDYGELVIVKHNDQWLSAYGHNRSRIVNEGQGVKAGQQIAEMGHSGAARDMLHFEIRYNGKPVDPLQYLPKK